MSTVSEIQDMLFSQLMSGDFSLPGYPSPLNPNKVILTVNRNTKQVLWCSLNVKRRGCGEQDEIPLLHLLVDLFSGFVSK